MGRPWVWLRSRGVCGDSVVVGSESTVASSASLGRLLLGAATLLVVAPMWLGPSLVPLLRAVHESAHTCACGMAPGKCGCPVCVRVERERRQGLRAGPVIRATCDDDSILAPRTPGLLFTPHRELTVALLGTSGELPVQVPAPPLLPNPEGPPTPPPRV